MVDPISPALKQVLKEASDKHNSIINASIIQEENIAEKIAEKIYQEILEYQSSLSEENDIAINCVQFGSSVMLVDSIGYIGYNLIKFSGKDNSGKPTELIQHVTQLNFFLTTVPKSAPEEQKRPIGFVCPS